MNDIATYLTPEQLNIPMMMNHTGAHWKKHERALRLLTRRFENGDTSVSRKAYAVRKVNGGSNIHVFISAEPVDNEGNAVGLGCVVNEVLVEKYGNQLFVRYGKVIFADGSGRVYEIDDNEYEWMLDKTSPAGQEFVKEVKKHLHKFNSDGNWVDASWEF